MHPFKSLTVLITLLIFTSCDSEDDCKCKGQFATSSTADSFLTVEDVDCATGQPALDVLNDAESGGEFLFFQGCVDE